MGIEILGPDVNEGMSAFSAADGKIRFGLSAIKGVGDGVIESIIQERTQNGPFTSMEDFMKRLSSKEVNRHTIENFIKSGAFDSMDGTRKQKFYVYESMLEHVNREKKDNLAGQLSLFDMGDEELDQADRITFPNVGEWDKEEFLMYEKEVLGIYISGHPLEEYVSLMEKNCTRNSLDFQPSAENEEMMAAVDDGEKVVVGGMIISKSVKTTRQNTMMAFLTVEDLYGNIEVVVFPRDYEKNKPYLEVDSKVFVKGRAQVEEGRGGKILCRQIIPFEKIPCELWIRFPDIASFQEKEKELYQKILPFDGADTVCIYAEKEKQVKKLARSYSIDARRILQENVLKEFGENALAIREKSIEK